MRSARNASPDAGFSGIGIKDSLGATVTAVGYEEPTPIQRETIPIMLSGRDLPGRAATGTGKTAAFALPLIQRLIEEPRGGRRRTRGPVLVPTRELTMQVAESIHKYASGTGPSVVPIYGGVSMQKQKQTRALDRGADIIVATPGRALDHLRRKTLGLDALLVLVLDEADEMLDMGFAEDLDLILQATPATRQTALFFATMPPGILAIARRHLKDAQRITIGRERAAGGKLPRIRQVAYVVRRAQKPEVLGRVLDIESPTSAIVFCRTRLDVDTLVETLNAHGYRAARASAAAHDRAVHEAEDRGRHGSHTGRHSRTAPRAHARVAARAAARRRPGRCARGGEVACRGVRCGRHRGGGGEVGAGGDGGRSEDKELAAAPSRVAKARRAARPDSVVRLYVGAGRQTGIRLADLVGAITGEARITSNELGANEIADWFSLVEVPAAIADRIIAAMKKTTLRGQQVVVRRSRESHAGTE